MVKHVVVIAVCSLGACSKSHFKGEVPNAEPAIADITTVGEQSQISRQETISTPEKMMEMKPNAETKSEIIFGTDGYYRLGDGYAAITSSCAMSVNTLSQPATTFKFAFEVLEDNTNVELVIGKICGVDKPSHSVVNLIGGESRTPIVIPVDTDPARTLPLLPFGSLSLNKGNYSFAISSLNTIDPSRKKPADAPPTYDEFDDFLVGNLTIRGNKLIKSLGITPE